MASLSFVGAMDDLQLQLFKKSPNRKKEEKLFRLRFIQMNLFIPRPLSSWLDESGKSWTQQARWSRALQLASPSSCGQKGDVAIVWLRRELRLHDNIALVEAAKEYRRILPVFIYEEPCRTTEHHKSKYKDRTDFAFSEDLLYEDLHEEANLLEMCLRDLKKQLQNVGSDLLVVLTSNAVESLYELIVDTGAEGLYFYRSVFAKERRQESELKRRLGSSTSVNIYTFWTNTLHPFDQLISKSPLQDCDQFGKYIHDWDVPKDIPSPEYLKPFPYERLDGNKYVMDDNVISRMKKENHRKQPHLLVSERQALNLLSEFVSCGNGGWIQHYSDEAKIDTKYGRMNPFLSLGCISMRTIYRRVMENIPHSLRRYCVEMDLIFREFLMLRYFQTA